MMRSFVFLMLALLLVQQVVAGEGGVRQLTVTDYLQQAAARAKAEGRKANNLIHESSPYLLQHAYNPVNWYAWGEAAVEKAKRENKPIFLSIGYSTCHWCHVMAHESFENKKIAELLNKYFVCIKVDREQRPDIDSVYMSATRLINGHGGWPMSVFLDHRLRPFHAATYYPPFSSAGRKGLDEILLKIHELWEAEPDLINEVATTVTASITQQADDTAEHGVLAENIYQLALQDIAGSYEPDFGGFSAAPKFPRPGIFSFLNQLISSDRKDITAKAKIAARTMMQTTLDAMASGGIFDQVAGGFHRYSVDGRWQVPHFEKMLYSQALMVLAYDDFYKLDERQGSRQRYRQVISETLAFVSHEIRYPDVGFYSALDADSEPAAGKDDKKAEGAYYLWYEAELREVLPAAEFEFVKKYFQVSKNGNILSDPHDEFNSLNILYLEEDLRNAELSMQEIKWLASAKKRLNAIRQNRPRPHLDDKFITAWNGMMVSAFARSSMTLDNEAFLQQAIQTAGFIKTNLYNKKTGRLYRQYRKGDDAMRAGTEAMLSDYAWLIHGLLDIYDATLDEQWMDWAYELLEKQDDLFLDKNSGAYFDSASQDSSLLFRSKSIYDDALPSANAMVLSNLRKLSGLAVKPSMKQSLASRADRLVSSFAEAVNQNPSAAAMLLSVELEWSDDKRAESEQ